MVRDTRTLVMTNHAEMFGTVLFSRYVIKRYICFVSFVLFNDVNLYHTEIYYTVYV